MLNKIKYWYIDGCFNWLNSKVNKLDYILSEMMIIDDNTIRHSSLEFYYDITKLKILIVLRLLELFGVKEKD
ncbi:MAG: hypothetical protein ACRDD7_07235 [Peptostreptococcaceae bacterium]